MKNKKGMSAILATLLLVILVVAMGAIVYSWSSGLIGETMKEPDSTGELLTLEYGIFNSNETVTLSIRNIGDGNATLERVYIEGTNGDIDTIDLSTNPNKDIRTLQVQDVDINTNTLSFSQGYIYTFKIVTSYGNQFVFVMMY